MSLIEEAQIPETKREVSTFAVREYPDEMLKTKAQLWISDVKDARFQELVEGIEATLKSYGAAGLAGPQVGIPYRILAVNRGGKIVTMVNPRITKVIGDRVDGNEGCLSFPGLYIKVKRAAGIEVVYTNRDGESVTETLKGFDARAVQHEIDHLDGVVFVDRIPKVFRSAAMRKWRLAPRVARQQEAQLQKLLEQFKTAPKPAVTEQPVT